ncbi:SHOCT domain-containing protein [Gordonia sp. NPDC058843]|uniref:SHOCT domain-containing protein n=1 Tax=Gordonia sp. NPDC058843 TaxID=3346648 RepID=UPI0036A27CB8
MSRTDQFDGPYDVVYRALLTGLTAAGFTYEGRDNPITAHSPRAILKNRWAATLTAGVRPATDTITLVDWSIDTQGRQHHLVLDEVVAGMPIQPPVGPEEPNPAEASSPKPAVSPSTRALRADVEAAVTLANVRESDPVLGRAVHRLNVLLTPDERVRIVLHGSYELKLGLLCLTTERLLYVGEYLGPRVEVFPFDAIESLGFRRGLITSDIAINMASHVALFSEPRPTQLVEELVVETTAAREGARRQNTQIGRTGTGPRVDIASTLRHLADLHAEGLISDEEYGRKKAELLDRM